jgi:hypothetical protein
MYVAQTIVEAKSIQKICDYTYVWAMKKKPKSLLVTGFQQLEQSVGLENILSLFTFPFFPLLFSITSLFFYKSKLILQCHIFR